MDQSRRFEITNQIRLHLLCCVIALLVAMPLAPLVASAEEATAASSEVHADLGETGAKLANPLSDLWSLTFDINILKTYDGNFNNGDPKVGSGVVFQPVMPFSLYGRGDAEWRLITRPIIPIVFSQPVPTGLDEFDHISGIGDIQLPLVLSVPQKYAGSWILGGGPTFMFPTATNDALGSDQYAAGPAVVVGYKTKKWTAVLFPNYYWKVGSSGQDNITPDISQGSMLYSFTLHLPEAWQAGFNPTITYNDNATSGNKWNVPVGGFVGKTIKVGKTPLNIRFGLEYSVVSEDDFGKRTMFRVQITPVISSPLDNPLFGGGT